MSGKLEQLCPGTRPGYRRFVKRATAKAIRRAQKKQGADAPAKRWYRGYSD